MNVRPVVLSLLAVTSVAAADQPTLKQLEKYLAGSDPVMVANAMAECAGVYEALSAAAKKIGRPAESEDLKNRHNGAMMAAEYLLAVNYQFKTGKKRKLGAFDPYVQGIIGTSSTHYLALLEASDQQELNAEATKCKAVQPTINYVVEQLRSQLLVPQTTH